jgi:putative nucleotidyltransferase with HDIG domain
MPDAAAPTLQDVLKNLDDMPALPTVIARLTRLIADPATTAADINAVLSSDPGLVTKILRQVNSSFYGFSRRIATITNAVVILGFNQVRNLALSAFVFDAFGGRRGSDFDISGFWRHSIGTAFLASRLAGEIDPKLEEDAFICGLLHDLGKFIMARHAEEHMAAVLEKVEEKDILFGQAEMLRLAYNHAVLGAHAMELWNLPESLCEVVLWHHSPLKAPEEAQCLACVTNMADIVARAMLFGSPGDRRIPLLAGGVWERVGVDTTRLGEIMRKVAEDYSKSDAFFSS